MGLWARLARVFTRRDPAAREAAERVLLEADFGVAATAEIKDRLAPKLARRLERGGRPVLLAAADTFRAGAVEQLRVWADRLGVPCVGGTDGKGDPAAVAFQAREFAAAVPLTGLVVTKLDDAGRYARRLIAG